ncbi:5-carboxymethyl-2-hydroxymuconate Delta-isomerase [Endozoicomonas sp. 8E]|uniref:5-carboxymethyl-2-hydroxymuconate Delta-isomerase n=1 Tax=Endozoicomonas sp. 8E TaxID=3035692 RepID=UPI00293941F1|nr:5-carboxymethyl-2-hydroxymuconate Delta-isomerase [Endozoicomonas sp. 8E]WOG29032.1 5-carboxymethyl-2-hydroxymuconate Delta-isomerase [Endozoicomonas sp. 8E]
MPHCIIEYSSDVEQKCSIRELVSAVHQSTLESGLFKAEDIKSRAIPYEHFQTAQPEQSFVHITARIMKGRTSEQKKSLSQKVLNAADQIIPWVNILSVEILDIDTDCYSKRMVQNQPA